MAALGLGLFAPFVGVKKALLFCNPAKPGAATMYAVFAQLMFVVWFLMHICQVAAPGLSSIAWLAYTFMAFVIAMARGDVRRKEKIWGNMLEDFFVCLAAYPFALAQLSMHADTKGDGKRLYFAAVDEMIAEMDKASP